jgi:hypothetical protein
MTWFRQNRLLAAFLIAFGICVLFAVILLFWTGSKLATARGEFNKTAAEHARLEALDPFPNEANYHKLKDYIENYRVALDKFKEELKKEMIPETPLAPNEFQSRLRQAIVSTLNRARTSNTKLPDNFRLGFDEFATALPKTAVTPLLGQELSQVQMLISILLDARVDSVTSFHRAPLTEEREPKAAPTATPVPGRFVRRGTSSQKEVPSPTGTIVPKVLERNIVNLTFKAGPDAARRVLNEIASSNGQFYIIRTLYVRNEKDQGPPREKGAEPAPAGAGAAAPNQPAPAGALNFIVGNEHVEISATIEMLRFSF